MAPTQLIPSGFSFCLGPGGGPEKYHVNISTKEKEKKKKSIQLYLTSIFPGIFRLLFFFIFKRSIHSAIGADAVRN